MGNLVFLSAKTLDDIDGESCWPISCSEARVVCTAWRRSGFSCKDSLVHPMPTHERILSGGVGDELGNVSTLESVGRYCGLAATGVGGGEEMDARRAAADCAMSTSISDFGG